jgi:hypothetical protein
MIGGQYYRSPDIRQLPFIPAGPQQQPYVSDLYVTCKINELFC